MSERDKIVLLAMVSALVFAGSPPVVSQDLYSPFLPQSQPKMFDVTSLDRISDLPELELGIKGKNGKPDHVLISLRMVEEGTTAEIFDKSGKSIKGPLTISKLHWPENGYIADLNGDGMLDYVVEVWSGGNGLAASLCETAFFLSAKQGYTVTITNSRAPERSDFLDLNGNGHCQLLHRAFIDGSSIRGKDGKNHNYWVYNILEIAGDHVELRNSIIPGFPRWILYAFRENHRTTNQLTDAQKAELWKSQIKCLIWSIE